MSVAVLSTSMSHDTHASAVDLGPTLTQDSEKRGKLRGKSGEQSVADWGRLLGHD